jgi:hypothetical protein
MTNERAKQLAEEDVRKADNETIRDWAVRYRMLVHERSGRSADRTEERRASLRTFSVPPRAITQRTSEEARIDRNIAVGRAVRERIAKAIDVASDAISLAARGLTIALTPSLRNRRVPGVGPDITWGEITCSDAQARLEAFRKTIGSNIETAAEIHVLVDTLKRHPHQTLNVLAARGVKEISLQVAVAV